MRNDFSPLNYFLGKTDFPDNQTVAKPVTFQPTDMLNSLKAIDHRDYNLADYSYEVIIKRIKEFEAGLDEEHEVAIKLASFGQSITLLVTDILYSNPNILIFYGYVDNQEAALIQDKSQLNFLLLAVQKEDSTKPPRRIGFGTTEDG